MQGVDGGYDSGDEPFVQENSRAEEEAKEDHITEGHLDPMGTVVREDAVPERASTEVLFKNHVHDRLDSIEVASRSDHLDRESWKRTLVVAITITMTLGLGRGLGS